MSDITHLTDISIVDGNIKVNINLSQFNDRFKEAQQWLGDRVLEDSRAFMPLRTGSLQQRSHIQNDGREVVFPALTLGFSLWVRLWWILLQEARGRAQALKRF